MVVSNDDNAGNILTKKTYALTAAGVTHTNPTDEKEYTYSFTYNDESIRVSKTVGNITTTYIYNGTRLVVKYTSNNVIIYN